MISRETLNKIILTLLNVSIAIVLGWFVYFLFLERPFLYYTKTEFLIDGGKHFFKQGDIVPLQVPRCNRDDRTRFYTVSHSLVNLDTNQSIVMKPTPVSIQPGCPSTLSKINQIPEDTIPGRYMIVGGSEINGRLQTHEVSWTSEPFTVIAK